MDFNGMDPNSWEHGVKNMCTDLIQQRQGKRSIKRKTNNNTREADYRKEFDIAKKILKTPNNNIINVLTGPSLTPIILNNNRALIAYNMLVDIRSKRQKPNGGTRKRTHRRTRKRKL